MDRCALKAKISGLPQAPGVYIFKDKSGRAIYIGKAKSLKKRVQSYFSRLLDAKTQAMVARIAGLEYALCPSERQARILEAELVRKKQPQYNIDLKDDKSFPWIMITAEDFPQVLVCRRKDSLKPDAALYFGPYTNAAALRQALKSVRRIFGFRSCRKMPGSACLYYRLKLCPAPCVGRISRRGYQDMIKEVGLFLESRYSELIERLAQKMRLASAAKDFEEAARLRDQISALSAITSSDDLACITQLEDLKRLLGLKLLPQRIEAFDVSNISGQEACGSMVSFHKGLPDKNNYRRFRIKSVSGIDDYGMISEVVQRRYARLLKEGLAFPDLVIIDGGRSHLMIAQKALARLGLDLPLASIAKEEENIYIKGKGNPVKLSADTPALNLIRRVRDEAHRFAVAYHHILRRKRVIGK